MASSFSMIEAAIAISHHPVSAGQNTQPLHEHMQISWLDKANCFYKWRLQWHTLGMSESIIKPDEQTVSPLSALIAIT